MTVYVLVMAIVALVMGTIWKRDDWGNTAIKLALLGLAVWGFVLRFGQW